MARHKKEQTQLPPELQDIPLEGNLTPISKFQPPANLEALEKALESPYDPSSIEHKIFTLAKESHATLDEICLVLGESKEYISEEMSDVIERGYTACKILLRQQQLRSARDGDSKQLTWLGKQILGQDDKITLDIPMTIMVDTGIRRE